MAHKIFLLLTGGLFFYAISSTGEMLTQEQVFSRQETPLYSDNSLIIALDIYPDKVTVADLCKRYDLEILYIYNNFNMISVKARSLLSKSEFAELIAALDKADHVLQVNRDAIAHIDRN